MNDPAARARRRSDGVASAENRSADGTISYPLGRDAVGLITYTDDGYVFVAITQRKIDAAPSWLPQTKGVSRRWGRAKRS